MCGDNGRQREEVKLHHEIYMGHKMMALYANYLFKLPFNTKSPRFPNFVPHALYLPLGLFIEMNVIQFRQ